MYITCHIFAGDVGINGSRYAPATKLLSSIGYQDAHPSGLRLSNDKDLWGAPVLSACAERQSK
ncbi:MAG: hypothetical protein AAF399_02675 [Bacteroidota bacterium]